jgi:AmmeMemoRadiSam system protein A/AmmeMemoRadiSam system protein B
VEPTVDALRDVGRAIAAYEPETLVLISPHGPLQPDAMSIGLAPQAHGDFRDFRAPQVTFEVPCDVELARSIQDTCKPVVIDVQPVDALTGSGSPAVYRLDHGAAVPLHFLLPLLPPVKVVLLGFSGQPRSTHTAFGQRIRQACEASGRRVAFVASGDLSHRLSADGPYGFDPQGPVFDEQVVAALAGPDWDRLRDLPQPLVDRAGVCGYLSMLTLAGAIGGDVQSRVLSYQGPFGVGYAVAEFEPKGAAQPKRSRAAGGKVRLTADTVKPEPSRPALNAHPRASSSTASGSQETRSPASAETVTPLDAATPAAAASPEGRPVPSGDSASGAQPADMAAALLSLARESLETYVRTRARLELRAEQPAELRSSQSCFVTLYERGQLRGCVGSIVPTRPSLAHEVVDNAISAGTRDYRFGAVVEAELPDLAYSVDVLSPLEPAKLSDMDPAVYGMVVMQGSNVGVLLPALPQVTEVALQFQVCCEKAGITDPTGVDIYRFTVQRYAEAGAVH